METFIGDITCEEFIATGVRQRQNDRYKDRQRQSLLLIVQTQLESMWPHDKLGDWRDYGSDLEELFLAFPVLEQRQNQKQNRSL